MVKEKFKVGDFEIEVSFGFAGLDKMTFHDCFNVLFSVRYENQIYTTYSMRDVRDFIKNTIYENAKKKIVEDKEELEAKRIVEELKKIIQEAN